MFDAQTQWIIDNRSVWDIAYVTGLGDIVDSAADTAQWDIGYAACSWGKGVAVSNNYPRLIFMSPDEYLDPRGALIVAGASLDALTTPGKYYANTTLLASQIVGIVNLVQAAFTLVVEQMADASIIQTIKMNVYGIEFQRSYNGSAWTSWSAKCIVPLASTNTTALASIAVNTQQVMLTDTHKLITCYGGTWYYADGTAKT
jgi:hypothetical protein